MKHISYQYQPQLTYPDIFQCSPPPPPNIKFHQNLLVVWDKKHVSRETDKQTWPSHYMFISNSMCQDYIIYMLWQVFKTSIYHNHSGAVRKAAPSKVCTWPQSWQPGAEHSQNHRSTEQFPRLGHSLAPSLPLIETMPAVTIKVQLYMKSSSNPAAFVITQHNKTLCLATSLFLCFIKKDRHMVWLYPFVCVCVFFFPAAFEQTDRFIWHLVWTSCHYRLHHICTF